MGPLKVESGSQTRIPVFKISYSVHLFTLPALHFWPECDSHPRNPTTKDVGVKVEQVYTDNPTLSFLSMEFNSWARLLELNVKSVRGTALVAS